MNLNLSQQIRELFLPCLLEGGVVDLAGDYQAEARVELIFPAEIEGDHAQRVVEVLRAGMGHLRGATLMGAANDYRAPARTVTSFTTYLGPIAGRQTRGSRHPGFNAPRGSGAPPATIPPGLAEYRELDDPKRRPARPLDYRQPDEAACGRRDFFEKITWGQAERASFSYRFL